MLTKVTQVLTIGLVLVAFTGADYARYVEHIKQLARNETFVKMFNEHAKLFQDNSKEQLRAGATPFNCNTSAAQGFAEATSVHQLRPTDINVVGALGDSITAGTGITASTVIGLLREDRGLSWSIGGDKNIQTEETVPNMLKTYNPSVKGFSTGWGPVWLKSSSKFNVASPGDKSEDIPGQANELVARMKDDSSIDFQNDWKVITLFIGGNDLCDFCDDKTKFSAENYKNNVEAGLDILHANIPRAFVNVVQVLDISIVKRLNANLICDALHLFGCACAAYPSNSEAEQELQAETKRYRELLHDLIVSGKYDDRDDFTVVEQTFFMETLPPDLPDGKPDLSYFSPDCFHLSLKGHRAAADGLWNNMVEPEGKKRVKWTPGEEVECPTAEAPYFYTRKNSGLLGAQSKQETSNQFGSSFMQEPVGNAGDQQPEKGTTSHSGAVVAVGVGLGLLAVLAVAVFARRRHNRRSQEEENQLLADKWTNKNYN